MTGYEFQAHIDAEPFVPFTMTLNGGWEVTVERPETASVTPHGFADITLRNGRRSIVSLDHVNKLDFITPAVTGDLDTR